MERSDREIAFLAGLLHDIGRIVLFSLGDKVEVVGFQTVSGQVIICREQEVFHCSHMQAGYWFLKGISIPDEVTLPVLHHHDFGEQAEYPFIFAPVRIAEGLVSKLSDNEAIDSEWSQVTEAIAIKFGIDHPVLSECLQLLEMEDEFIHLHFQE